VLLVHDNLIHSNRPASLGAAESAVAGDASPSGKLPQSGHQA
jgi:hypothetical protein